MKILNLDTATEACSVALYVDGEIYSQQTTTPQSHSDLILSMIEKVMTEADLTMTQLDAIGFSRGPGSFTGLRIGTGVTQGLAYAADLPVIPISSLATLAQGVVSEQPEASGVLAAIDARMGEVYWGTYKNTPQGITLLGNEKVINPEDTPIEEGRNFIAAGTGWQAYGETLKARHQNHISHIMDTALPFAKDLAVLSAKAFTEGLSIPADQAIPVYLRDNVAKKAKSV